MLGYSCTIRRFALRGVALEGLQNHFGMVGGDERMKKEILRRYAMFLAGVLICAVGIALITRAGLGTSPISSIPFVLSLITSGSMGAYTFLFNLAFLAGEALLRRRFTWTQALQIPATVVFSLCIDGALALIPTQYGGPYSMSVLYLAVGCAVMALGISLEVLADVIMLPGEAFVRALSGRFRREFGNVKVCFDSVLTLTAAAVALLAFHRLNGVREGTLISALAVGRLIQWDTRRMEGWGKRWLAGPCKKDDGRNQSVDQP